MKKLLATTCSIALLSVAGQALAAEHEKTPFKLPGEFSSTLSFVSDYVFRGITQTNEGPAVQGSIDYSLPTEVVEFYAGVWGSNVDFADGDEANLEIDWSGGIRKTIDKLTLDLGAFYYTYPGASEDLEYDYFEGTFAAEYDFGPIALNASASYSPENFGESGHAEYYSTGFSIPTPIEVTFDGHVGKQYVEKNDIFEYPDYTDWALGIGYNFSGFDLKLEYVDTDLGKTECAGGSDGCDAKAVFTVSRTF